MENVYSEDELPEESTLTDYAEEENTSGKEVHG